jgi:UDPglucose--hexose-1-phosphate uridylyltransferase
MESEVRYEEFTGRIVIVAKGRRKRPHAYQQKVASEGLKECPFCPGHESETPKATLLYVMEGSGSIVKTSDPDGSRRSDWLVRAFPNAYPALSTEATSSAYGYHEVVVENPDHFWTYEKAELNSIELALRALIDRGRFMESDSKVKYVTIFKNHDKEAGASITHPHYQIIGSAFVPPSILRELDSYLKKEICGNCYFCSLPNNALDGGRLVFENEHFSVLTPFTSIFPYECWIIPRRHSGSFLDSSTEEIKYLSETLKELFIAYAKEIGIFPFNIIFHSGLVGIKDFHWHLEIYPRITVHAGFELSSGAYINIVEPEEAALKLRQARSNHSYM